MLQLSHETFMKHVSSVLEAIITYSLSRIHAFTDFLSIESTLQGAILYLSFYILFFLNRGSLVLGQLTTTVFDPQDTCVASVGQVSGIGLG